MAPVAVLGESTNLKGRAVEDIYQKKTQLEHILLRPDTYIGSTEHQQQQLWVHDGEKMVMRSISFVPGLYKIFDEILVNAADNKVRDSTMDTIKVDIDETTGRIQVWNNGNGIPVEMHKKEGVYVPELIFGHLLTSSNYDDTEKKVTGGRNGYGAKLANIFSTEFVVETCDGTRQKRYRQVFSNNMAQKGEPRVTACKASDNWTSITFTPDYAKFGMEGLDVDMVALMRKRTYDLCGVVAKGMKVYYNGQRLAVKTFQDYVNLYLGPKDNGVERVFEKVGDRWEICISPTDGQFQQVSFVNSICTSKGGTHVKLVLDQVCKQLAEKINKKNKNANVKDFMVKNHVWIFLNCSIENPAFDSQTKDTLTLKASSFGSKCVLPIPFIEKVGKCGVMDSIVAFATFKQDRELKKTDGAKRCRLIGIPKLDDANDAGGRNSDKCTLILTEGDSAKALAISGLSVVGRDSYGVFPLRGKLLNVRDASSTQVNNNAEITALKQIIGLQHGKTYTDTKGLRYGHVMIMTDQDHDGSHIKGLIMNYLHHFYPSLLQVPGFLVEFITPIVKATKGAQTKTFYTMPEYENWKDALNNNLRGWSIKYYKGLGTSTSKEAKEYFAGLATHKKRFVWEGDEDGQSIELAFSKKKIEERKAWLRGFVPGTFLDHTAEVISYSDFINRELILFSRADVERSIPSMLDGLKPGQRKILYSCFKRNLKSDIKVAQLAGYVSEHSAYHHGEASLQSTITGLAQDFVGSNNINLLFPSGQFGTRLQGGKDSASPRYIFTRLAPLTRHLFNEADDALLTYQHEEGQSIEPEWYLPILPLVLVNGADGIGTGWSTSIPNYNPQEIVANLRRLLKGEDTEPMAPWYKGFTGAIDEVPSARNVTGRSFQATGTVTELPNGDLEISELPVRKWTQDYKEFLDAMVKPDAKDAVALVHDYREHHTDLTVKFTVTLTDAGKAEATAKGLLAFLKLTGKMHTSNMMLFDSSGVINKYESTDAVLHEFYALRLTFYGKRRALLLAGAHSELMRISNKVKFILAVINEDLKVSNRRRAELEADMVAMGFDRMSKTAALSKRNVAAAVSADDDEDGAVAATADTLSFEYLLSMSISSLTKEKVESLKSEEETQHAIVEKLEGATGESLWTDDLDSFDREYQAWLDDEIAAVAELAANQAKALKAQGRKAPAKGKAAAKKPKKKAMDSDDEDSDDEDSEDDFQPVATKPAAKPAAKRAPAKASTSKAAAAKPAARAAAAAPTHSSDSLTAQLGGMALQSQSGAGPSKASAVISMDSDGDEMMSPAPALAAGRLPLMPPAKAAPKAPAKRAPAKAKPAAAAKAAPAKAPVKRKPAAKKRAVLSDSDGTADEDVAGPSAAFAADPPTPSVAPTAGKVRKMRPSPFHKGSGATKASSDDESSDAGADSDAENSMAAAVTPPPATRRPARRAAAAAPSKYTVDLVTSEEEGGESEGESDDDFNADSD